KGLCPNAEDFYQREISLPMYPALKEEELELVVKRLRNLIDG
ncbi:MAG: DegT/DnrJ/EryC1/StrS family aminotransferase, partial [Aquificaceae bacterium]